MALLLPNKHEKFFKGAVNKLLPAVSIGLPALSRFLFTFTIKLDAGIETTGNYANDLNIATIFATISATGFSALALNKIPQVNTKSKDNPLFTLLTISVGVCLVEIIALLLMSGFLNLEDTLAAIFFIVGYTAYQLIRTYYIALHRYAMVVQYEAILLVAVCTSFLFIQYRFLMIHSVYLIILSVFYIALIPHKKLRRTTSATKDIQNATGFGLSNLASSLTFYLSVPIAHTAIGPIYSGILGLVNPLLNIMLIVPRSFNLHFTPNLIKSINSSSFQKQFNTLTRYTNSSLFISGAMLIIVWFLFPQSIIPSQETFQSATPLVIITIINIIAAQVSLPYSTLLLVNNDSKLMLLINTSISVVFLLLVYLISLAFMGQTIYISIYISLILLNLIKYFVLKKKYGNHRG